MRITFYYPLFRQTPIKPVSALRITAIQWDYGALTRSIRHDLSISGSTHWEDYSLVHYFPASEADGSYVSIKIHVDWSDKCSPHFVYDTVKFNSLDCVDSI